MTSSHMYDIIITYSNSKSSSWNFSFFLCCFFNIFYVHTSRFVFSFDLFDKRNKRVLSKLPTGFKITNKQMQEHNCTRTNC